MPENDSEGWIRDIDDERIPDNWRSLLHALEPYIDRWQMRQRHDASPWDGTWECLVSRGEHCWTIFTVIWAFITEPMVVEEIRKRLDEYEHNHIDGEYKSDVLLRDIVWSLESSDARDAEYGHCVICQESSENWGPHEPGCSYVEALAYVNSWAEKGDA